MPTDSTVVDLLGIVVAAREPLSSAHLDSLGLLGAQQGTVDVSHLHRAPSHHSLTAGFFNGARDSESDCDFDCIDDAALPGFGLLFEDREHLLQMIHLSLREFLLDVERSVSYAADARRGNIILAQSCLQILLERTTGPTLAYALRHGHVHLTEVMRICEERSDSSVDSLVDSLKGS